MTVTVRPGATGAREATLTLADLEPLELTAVLTRWTLSDGTAVATAGDYLFHQLLMSGSSVALASLANPADVDAAPDAASFFIQGSSFTDLLILSGFFGGLSVRVSGGGGDDTLGGPSSRRNLAHHRRRSRNGRRRLVRRVRAAPRRR